MVMEWYYNILLILGVVVAGATCVAVIANKRYNRKSR